MRHAERSRFRGFLSCLAASIAILGAVPAIAAGGGEDKRAPWWEWSTGHTIQEKAFYRWMCTRFGREFAHTMQEETIRRYYSWWLINVWNGPPPTGQ